MNKEFISMMAIVLTLVGFFPYIMATLRESIQPHVISWLIWSASTLIVFIAQLSDGGGTGAWPIGVSALVTVLVAGLALCKRADKTVDLQDWLALGVAMSAIPLWFLTSSPLVAVVMITLIDVVGFVPTIRTISQRPHSESLTFFIIFGVRNLLVLMALEHYSLTTVLFPACVAMACWILIVFTLVKRSRQAG